VSTARQIRLFRNGRRQEVRIPRALELPGDRALIRKDGNCLIIEPLAKPSLLKVLAGLHPIREPFPDVDSQPADPMGL